jgi:uncharacterized glyoxalase superfamily protein PhnB
LKIEQVSAVADEVFVLKMTATNTIPVLRIFDYAKAIEFYVEWLGFEVEFEHRFEENAPVYIEVRKGGIVLHLSEHYGDASPGSSVFIWCTALKVYQESLLAKKYKYYRPSLEETFYGSWCMKVLDPFGNKLLFNEKRETPIR